MSEQPRIAVYIDFDNIVISQYDRVHGQGRFHEAVRASEMPDPATLAAANVDLGAVLDYASSYGTVAQVRAYADWSRPVNASYRSQLVARSIELVQLFPAAAYGKNGADIRLAIDAVEDMFRLPDVTHVVIVAGDSDYVPLAQRLKRLNRYVVGVGVAGSTARSLASACDRFASYQDLPGVEEPQEVAAEADSARSGGKAGKTGARKTAARKSVVKKSAPKKPSGGTEEPRADAPAAETSAAAAGEATTAEAAVAEPGQARSAAPGSPGALSFSDAPDLGPDPQAQASQLLRRALALGEEKSEDGWQHGSWLKNQMLRLDPSFSEKALGFSSFSQFLKSCASVVELDDSQQGNRIRLRENS